MKTGDLGPPVVVIPAETKEIDGFTLHAAVASYINAVVYGSGGIPLMLPSMGDAIDFDALLQRVDGVLLPGSRSNVHPSLYGVEAHDKAKPHDPRRDAVTLPLVRATLRHGVPMFAICRGMQELNVALGGSLVAEVHEIEGRSDHRAPDDDDLDVRYAIRQDIHVKPGSVLAGILGAETVAVNSLHRQAVDRLAEDLGIEATATDGTIEAVRVRNAASFALGVQWHPEYWVRTDAPSQRLFTAFGDAMRERMVRRAALTAAE